MSGRGEKSGRDWVYFYMVYDPGLEATKCGITGNLRKRFSFFLSHSLAPYEFFHCPPISRHFLDLRFEETFHFKPNNWEESSKWVENIWHLEMAAHRVRGEWFRVGVEAAGFSLKQVFSCNFIPTWDEATRRRLDSLQYGSASPAQRLLIRKRAMQEVSP